MPRNVSLAKGTSDYNILFKFHKSVMNDFEVISDGSLCTSFLVVENPLIISSKETYFLISFHFGPEFTAMDTN